MSAKENIEKIKFVVYQLKDGEISNKSENSSCESCTLVLPSRMEVLLVVVAFLSNIFPPIGCEWIKVSIDHKTSAETLLSKSHFLQETLTKPLNRKDATDDSRYNKWKKSDNTPTWITKKSHPIAVSWFIPTTKLPEVTTVWSTKTPEISTVGTTEPPTTESTKPMKEKRKEDRGFSFSGLISFLRNIQESFMTRTKRSFGDKVKFLRDFRDKLLIEIEKRINLLWPPTATTKHRKSKRHLSGGHSEGHMDFPSAEGALMTICFLTFAVFLIKLVLQVINTIKSKHYSFNGFDTKAPSPIKIIKSNRNARKFSLTNADNLKNMADITDAIGGKMFQHN